MNEIKTLDLFSGIGGFSYSLERLCPEGAFRTIAFCEQDKFCQAVLKKHWPEVPIFDDVRTIDTDGLGRVDLICGGFPCQPWSVAGKRRGAEDDRDLWPEMVRLVEELQPRWVIGENVRNFVNEPMGLERSLSDLESIGYQAVPFIIGAVCVDAPHRRSRVWVLAHSRREYGQSRAEVTRNVRGKSADGRPRNHAERPGQDVADAEQSRSSSESIGDIGSVAKKISREEEGRNQSSIRTSTRSTDVADASGKQNYEQRRVSEQRWKTLGRSEQTPQQKEWQASADSTGRCGEGNEPVWLPESRMGVHIFDGFSTWMDEPDIPRVQTGVKFRTERLRAIGNSICPQVVEKIGRAIMSSYYE